MAKKTRRSARNTVTPETPARRPRFAEPSQGNAPRQTNARPPFLKAQDVGRRSMLKFVPGSVRTTQAKWGHQLIVDVQMRGGTTFSWGIGTDKPNLRLLVEHLISNPGKPLEVITMHGDRGSFIAIPQDEQPVNVEDDDEDVPF